jgi:hypothetical protein
MAEIQRTSSSESRNRADCLSESDFARLVRERTLPGPIRSHLDLCTPCREGMVRVAQAAIDRDGGPALSLTRRPPPPEPTAPERADRLARLRARVKEEADREVAASPKRRSPESGLLSALIESDVTTATGVAAFQARVIWPEGVTPPTASQLRLAGALLAKLEAALATGNAPEIWTLVERGYDAMRSTANRRRAVLEVLEWAFDEARRCYRYAEECPDERGQTLMELAGDLRRARRALIELDGRFAKARASDLRAILERSNRIGPTGVAVRLALATEALDARIEGHEDEDMAFKRVRRLFELAVNEGKGTTKSSIRK